MPRFVASGGGRTSMVVDTDSGEDSSLVTHPDIRRLAEAINGRGALRSVALTGLFILGCFYTLYFAQQFFLPVALALVFNFLLSPIVRGLARLRIPEAVGAAFVILISALLVAMFVYEFSGKVAHWANRVPQLARKVERGVREFRKPVEKVTSATQQVQKMANAAETAQRPTPVEIAKPGIGTEIFTHGFTLLLNCLVVVVLLYFLLASGDLFLRKLVHVLPSLQDKKRAVQIARDIEFNISRYLLTAAMINCCLGAAGGLAFWALGMPDPFIWGLMGAMLNFIPYIGALTTIGVVTLVATAVFPTLGHALLVPASYLGLAVLEGSFVTPWIMGRSLTLNPVVIFTSLIFWGWLWGIPGALLAVPLLAMFKIFCDHTEPLAPVGEFLGN
jgi:predicted PurR-regulated permease PerM